MKITVFGSGYVGLVTGACLAEVGNEVICVDVDHSKIERLKSGEVPIYEPGLNAILQRNRIAKRLFFTADIDKAVKHGIFQFIAVGTPPDAHGSADLRHVLTVAEDIGSRMHDYRVIVNKSTVPVGTADKVRHTIQKKLIERGLRVEFDVVSNPEFLKEGAAIEDFMKPDRIIVGTDNPRTTELLRILYAPFNRSHDRFVCMDIRSAELTKYAANAMLATKISFMNELANLAERLGADIEKVRVGIGSDPRIGYHFIYPGCGYGGSCFPKDIKALERTSQEVGYDAPLLRAVEEINHRQKKRLFEKMEAYFTDGLSGKVVALWGLAFKPNTDDMREASSVTLMELLWEKSASIRAFDPVALEEAKKIYGDHPNLVYCNSPEEALQGADGLAIVTEWNIFRSPDFDLIKSTLSHPVIFDGRNLYDPAQLKSLGLDYFAIGRGDSVEK